MMHSQVPGASLKARNIRKKQVNPADSVPPVEPAAPPKKPLGQSPILRILRGVLGLVMVVGIAGAVAWAARHYIRTSPRFAVTEIVTSGGKHHSSEAIANVAGIAKGQNVFTVDLDRARARLVADPWISEAQLSRQLPGTLSVRVVEREAAALLATGEGTYLITAEGAILKKVEAGDPTDLHVITGVKVEQLVDDREGAMRIIRRALDLASDYDHSPLAQRSPLEEVHVEGSEEMTLVVGKSAVTLKLGAAPYRRKLEEAVRIVAELDRRGAKPDSIMLDNEARPDRVVVRMR